MRDKPKRINVRGYLPEKASSATTLRFVIYLAGLIILIGYLIYALKQPIKKNNPIDHPTELLIEDLEISH